MKKKNKSIARQKRVYRIKPFQTKCMKTKYYSLEKRSLNKKSWQPIEYFQSKQIAECWMKRLTNN